MGSIHTEEYKGCTISIVPDNSAECPLTSMDPPEGMLFFTNTRLDRDHYWLEGDGVDADAYLQGKNRSKIDLTHYVLPIYKFDHSGVAYQTTSFNDTWDSGLVGMISIPKSVASKEWAENTEERALNYMRGVVKDFSSWANGDVYGYVVNDGEVDEVDSCWGFIGDYDGYILETARAAVDHYVEHADSEVWALKEWRRQVAAGLTLLGFSEWHE